MDAEHLVVNTRGKPTPPVAVPFLYPAAHHQEHLDLSEGSRVILLFPSVSGFNEEELGFGQRTVCLT